MHDVYDIGKIIIRLSMAIQTSIEYLSKIPLYELIDIIREVNEIGKEKQ